MTQKDKELLLKDLCARMPHGVIVDTVDCGKAILIGIKDGGLLLFDTIHNEEYDKPWDIEYCKPYLRSMSSMTEEERTEYHSYCDNYYDVYHINIASNIYFDTVASIDWLNKNHFDYRGLIEKGLAIEAPNNMYKILKT